MSQIGKMMGISELISELEEIREKFGETCVYVKNLSWGAVALNQMDKDQYESEHSEGIPDTDAGKDS